MAGQRRADYLAWRLGLEMLASLLSGRMARIAALPPAAALAPWSGEEDGAKPRDLFGAGAERVFTGAEARASEAMRRAAVRCPPRPGESRARRPAKPARGGAQAG